MVGGGPFGHAPEGRFNFEAPRRGVQYFEPLPRRIRAVVAGRTVADSSRVMLLHEQFNQPAYCFVAEDVLLDELRERGAFVYEDGLAQGFVGIPWDAVDTWLEEDEEVIGHVRDPYHRLELRDTSRPVTIALDGETLCETASALALFEASLPPRWYVPREDVRAELAPAADLRTACAYKGWADYYDVRVGDRLEPVLAWYYPEPLRGMERIDGRVCFFNERVDVSLDGVLQERPVTMWSRTRWADAERKAAAGRS